jgi:hypothetical protein
MHVLHCKPQQLQVLNIEDCILKHLLKLLRCKFMQIQLSFLHTSRLLLVSIAKLAPLFAHFLSQFFQTRHPNEAIIVETLEDCFISCSKP